MHLHNTHTVFRVSTHAPTQHLHTVLRVRTYALKHLHNTHVQFWEGGPERPDVRGWCTVPWSCRSGSPWWSWPQTAWRWSLPHSSPQTPPQTAPPGRSPEGQPGRGQGHQASGQPWCFSVTGRRRMTARAAETEKKMTGDLELLATWHESRVAGMTRKEQLRSDDSHSSEKPEIIV